MSPPLYRSMQTRERLPYIDCSKGILILLVVFYHIPSTAQGLNISTEALAQINSTNLLYSSFFMQCFFMLSGMVSNFDKSPLAYLKSNIQTILVPFLLFCVIRYITHCLYHHGIETDALFKNQGGQEVFFMVDSFWFLTALFFAKILYYFIRKASDKFIVRFTICLVCLTASILMSQGHGQEYSNYFHYRNGMAMLPFLCIGEYLKNLFERRNARLLISISCAYLIALLFSQTIGWPTLTPYVHKVYFDFNIIDIPRYLFFATTGSLLLISIGRWIKQNPLLEEIGKLSLIIYGFHPIVLKVAEGTLSKVWLPGELLPTAFIWYLAIGTITTAVCILLGEVITRTKLRLLFGKE